jgi:hypothetical protein
MLRTVTLLLEPTELDDPVAVVLTVASNAELDARYGAPMTSRPLAG